jgi:hypothetical protein
LIQIYNNNLYANFVRYRYPGSYCAGHRKSHNILELLQ